MLLDPVLVDLFFNPSSTWDFQTVFGGGCFVLFIYQSWNASSSERFPFTFVPPSTCIPHCHIFYYISPLCYLENNHQSRKDFDSLIWANFFASYIFVSYFALKYKLPMFMGLVNVQLEKCLAQSVFHGKWVSGILAVFRYHFCDTALRVRSLPNSLPPLTITPQVEAEIMDRMMSSRRIVAMRHCFLRINKIHCTNLAHIYSPWWNSALAGGQRSFLWMDYPGSPCLHAKD